MFSTLLFAGDWCQSLVNLCILPTSVSELSTLTPVQQKPFFTFAQSHFHSHAAEMLAP